MAADIKVGDLVVRVGACCDYTAKGLGKLFVVTDVHIADAYCECCGDEKTELCCSAEGWDFDESFPARWLRKIDPDLVKDEVTDEATA